MRDDGRPERAAHRSARHMLVATCTCVFLTMASMAVAMSPSAFPESSLRVTLGGGDGVTVSVGAAHVIPARYIDIQVGADMAFRASGPSSARVDIAALVFPTVGTSPPISMGVAADLTWHPARSSAHVGLVAGLDLLYLSRDLPAVLDVYIAPGWTFSESFSVAWQVEGRWYEDQFAWLLGSSDRVLFFAGVEVAF